jgi:hypothetical protein
MEENIISERLYNQNQSWNYEQVVICQRDNERKKFKISIRRNSHDFQSFAKVYVYSLTGSRWNEIVAAPISECKCFKVNYISKTVNKQVFLDDRNKFLKEAVEICF